MALPNTNITTTLVGQTLGTSSRDVGTLCTHPNINKWSKWKPVRHSTVSPLTEAELKAVNYGLFLPTAISVTQIPIIGKVSYQKPRGGAYNEAYRLGDFRNYAMGATIPLGTNSSNNDIRFKVYKGGSINPKYENFSLYTAANVIGGIDFTDLYGDLGTLYLGVLLQNNGDSEWFTNDAPIETGQSIVDIVVNVLHPSISHFVGTTSVLFFLTNVKKFNDDTYIYQESDRFYPIPTDNNNLNPIFIDITYEYPPGSQTYFANMRNITFLPNGYQYVAEIIFSSIGEAYIGGVVNNAYVEFFRNPDYTNIIQTNQLGTFTLGSEEERLFNVDVYGDMNGSAYWKIYANGEEIDAGAITR